MIRSRDLLGLAREPITPAAHPAALARAVSTLYYSLFHALMETARTRVSGCSNGELLAHYVATFDHKNLLDAAKHVCASENPAMRAKIKGGQLFPWTDLFPADPADPKRRMPSADLVDFCATFVKLQHLRHQADYHAEWNVSAQDALQHLADVEGALSAWDRCSAGDEALVLLFGALGVLTYRRDREGPPGPHDSLPAARVRTANAPACAQGAQRSRWNRPRASNTCSSSMITSVPGSARHARTRSA